MHFGKAFFPAMLGMAVSEDRDPAIFLFFATVVAVTILRGLYQSSHDALIHANVEKTRLLHAAFRLR